MSRQDKRRKFNEAVLNMLYPPLSPQPKEEDLEAVNNLSEGFDPGLVPGLQQWIHFTHFHSNYQQVGKLDQLTPGFCVLTKNLDDLGEKTSSNTSSSNDDGDDGDGGESGSQKLTRAQRKRLRRKKLKIDASRRGRIIGPLLPPPVDDDNRVLENESPSVRRNAAEEPASTTTEKPGETPTCEGNKSKVKQRRMAKKLARQSLSASQQEENGHQHQQNCKQY